MSLFDGVATPDKVEKEADRVKGQKQQPLDSGIQNLMIKYAYAEKANSGAMGIFIALLTEDKREIRMREYVTSGKAKGCKTFYEKVDGEGNKKQFNLPGFTLIDSLCQLVAGKSILHMDTGEATIKLYNYDKKSEVPTKVEMITDLVGKPICGCVLHTIEDQTSKNDATGAYEPNGKTRAMNTVDKFLDPNSRQTVSERDNNIDSAFAADWEKQWAGQINDESTEVKGAGLKGAPAASGGDAPKENLFG